MKRFITIAGLVITAITLLTVTACETPVAEPTGRLKPGPGIPQGSSGTSIGVPDPAYTGRRFNINALPLPAVWNALGHQHAYPDPFHFANGNKVVTAADWAARRKEISKILQFYEYGEMPSIDPDVLEITWQDSAGGATCEISFKHKPSNRTWSISIPTTLPSNANSNDKYDPQTGTGGYPLYFGSSGANWEGGTSNFPLSGTWADESNGSGNVPTLYGLDYTDPSAPSANSSYAWGMSAILTVMEGIDLNGDGTVTQDECGFGAWYNPNWIGLTGYSRNGKAAECIAAFAESRGGRRVGHASIGSAGSGGPAIERFLSPAGYQVGGSYADPLPLNGPGLMQFDGLIGKPWYMKKINNGDAIPGTSLSYTTTPGGTSDAYRMVAVRSWSPYKETYDHTPESNGTNPATNIHTPFVGWQNPADSWSGIQSLSEGRNETPGWFSVRFREFADLHYGLDIDHVRGQEGRGKYGVLCTIPFDQHYLAALIPPNGVIFQDGFIVSRNNPESQFANWLIIDEIYKFLGEQEGDEQKYIWRNGFMMTWGTHGSNTGNEAADRNYHAMKIFKGEATTAVATTDANLAKLRRPMFPVDDPIGRFDYYRMTWGRPGHPTIAERVRARVEPILTDYQAGITDLASQGISGPRAGGEPYYPANTPVHKGFKSMDWRGLIDQPEAIQ
jgi:hypothetical protein